MAPNNSVLEGWSPVELQGHQAPTKRGLSPVSAVGLVQPRGLVRKAKVEIISLDSYSS